MKKINIIASILALSIYLTQIAMASTDFTVTPKIIDGNWQNSNLIYDGNTSTYGGWSADCGTSSCAGLHWIKLEFNDNMKYSVATLKYTYKCSPDKIKNQWGIYDSVNDKWDTLTDSEICDNSWRNNSISIESKYITENKITLIHSLAAYFDDTSYYISEISLEHGFPQAYTDKTSFFDKMTGEGLYQYCVWEISKENTHIDGDYYSMDTGYCPSEPYSNFPTDVGDYKYKATVIGVNITEGVPGEPYIIDEVDANYTVYYTPPDPMSIWDIIKSFICSIFNWLWICQ